MHKTLADNPSEVFVVRFSPDGKLVATGCNDGAIRVRGRGVAVFARRTACVWVRLTFVLARFARHHFATSPHGAMLTRCST